MVGQAIQQSQSIVRGVRRFNPATDLYAVGHVLEEAFRPEHNMPFSDIPILREFGIFLWALNYAPGLAEPIDGFVWVEGGKIVGNLSISQNHRQPDRLYISNVGVKSDYRRQGIARALVQSVIDYAREHGIKTLNLNVRPANAGAIKLYEAFGFKSVETSGEWSIDTVPPIAQRTHITMRPLTSADDRAISELNLLTAIAGHPRPPASKFGLTWDERVVEGVTDFLTMRTTQRWVFEQDHKLGALVFVRASRFAMPHQIGFQVHPDFHGQVEDDLIAFALQQLAVLPARPIRVAATNAYAELIAALEQQGFRFVNGLTLMEMKTE